MKNKLITLLGPILVMALVLLYFAMPKKGTEVEQMTEGTQDEAQIEKQNPLEESQNTQDKKASMTAAEKEVKSSETEKGDKGNPLAWDRSFEELLDLSGVEKQIKNFDELLKKQLDFDMGSKDGPAWTKIMAKHFKSKFILAEIRKEFKNIPADELKEMVESFNDPLMKKVSKLEELATASEAQEQFEEFSDDYDKQPPNEERERLIKSIDQLSGSTENTVNMVMAMMKGAQVGQNAELPQSERIPPQEIDEAMKEIKPQIKEMMAVSMQKTQAFAYKDLPNEELKDLAEKLREKNVKKYQNLINKGITRAFSNMGENLGKDMAKLPIPEEEKNE
ncbi:MAG: hypothetical protein CME68_07585 [Halobacteriovoraceae bacterium]|nr:hypothetical protein [Halobacteriovoraceae bacterium]